MLPSTSSCVRTTLWCSLLAMSLAIVGLVSGGGHEAQAAAYQGFGSTTPGGAGGEIVGVTTLDDSGPGSLRDALSQGNRTIMFQVSGTITLTSMIKVGGPFITIDGSTALPPGITLANAGLYISGNNSAHDIIVQNLRVRNSLGDGITIRDSAYNIVIDHVSIQGARDGSIDVTRNASDVTIQWSILAENIPAHDFLSLIDYQALRISVHHNLWVKGQSRNPQSGWDNTLATTPPDIVTDIRNNLIWNFIDYGTVNKNNTRSNVVQNFYYSATRPTADRAVRVNPGSRVYTQSNYSLNGANVDRQGNQQDPFPATLVETTDACSAAQQVVDQAGARPLDAIDQHYLSTIDLPSMPCADGTIVTETLTAVVTDGNLTVTGDDTANLLSMQEVGTSGQWKITGKKGTLVNGSPIFLTAPVTGDININLNGGDDGLTVSDGSIAGHLFITMGAGNDGTTVARVTVGTFLHYEGSVGNDKLTLNNVVVQDPTFSFFSSIDMHDGNDVVNIKGFTAPALAVSLGAGKDKLTIQASHFLGGPAPGLSIDAGEDTDKVILQAVDTGLLSVDMGLGNKDLLKVQQSKATSNDLTGGDGTGDTLIELKSTLGPGTPIDFER